ncbi:MAG: exonuclease domain-containing protein [Azospirillaceae bacterium]|nr:exonuclease domain-containing protein [Azospirillaceae bacterium]
MGENPTSLNDDMALAEALACADFVAIDFETANAKRDSACAIGVVWVSGRRIVHSGHWLIRPREMRFDARNSMIHGITAEDVRHAPEFPQIWEMIRSHVDGRLVMAHNASFDISVLKATLAGYGLMPPNAGVACTVKISEAIWPDLTNHRLPTVAGYLGIDLRHHDALSDAQACAHIAMRAMDLRGHPTVDELLRGLGASAGKLTPHSYDPCSFRAPRPASGVPALDKRLAPLVRAADAGLFRGKGVVFTGTLSTLPRETAGRLVEEAGGRWQPGVRNDTDILVVGHDPGATKLNLARSKAARLGRPEIIDEREFMARLGLPAQDGKPKAAARFT